MQEGFIYILSNEVLKNNLLRIGRTKNTNSIVRSKQLSASTAIPNEFKLEKEFKFNDVYKYEKIVHSRLSDFRFKRNKEFFTCEIEFAEKIIKEEMINDLNDYIIALKAHNANLQKHIDSEEFTIENWTNLFDNLNWEYEVDYNNKPYTFILKTKNWEETQEDGLIIYNDLTLGFVSNKVHWKDSRKRNCTNLKNIKQEATG